MGDGKRRNAMGRMHKRLVEIKRIVTGLLCPWLNTLPEEERAHVHHFAALSHPVEQQWGTGYHPEQWTEKVAHEIQLGCEQLLDGKGFSRNEPLEQMSFYCFFRLMNGLGCTRLSFRGSRNNTDKYLYIHDQSRRRLWVYFRNDHQDFTF